MLALDLHLDQTATLQSSSTNYLQGLKKVPQDESAFQKELKKVQQEIQNEPEHHKVQEMSFSTDGTEKLTREIVEDAVSNKDSTPIEFLYDGELPICDNKADLFSSERKLTVDTDGALEEDVFNTDSTLEDHFSISTEELILDLQPEQETFLNLDADLYNPDIASLKDAAGLDEGSDKKAEDISDVLSQDTGDNELLQLLLTGQIPLERPSHNEAPLPVKKQSSNKAGQENLIGTSSDSLISVIDERTAAKETVKEGRFVSDVKFDGKGNAEMSLNLPQNSNGVPLTDTASTVTTSNVRFTEMLSAELQANAKEFVKTGSVVLKDNNSGTINLILHPEELGNVKIRLEVTDKVIAGKIVVSSEEAFNAFKANIDSLRQAFTDSGFEAGGFDLSWNNNSQNGGQEKDHNRHGFTYNNAIPEILDDSAFEMMQNAVIYGTSVINMIA